MIDLIFYYGTEIVLIRITGNNIQFATSMFGSMMSSIDGLKLSHSGVIKEYPELANSDNWREEGIKRFKNYISSLNNEEEIASYLVEDLKKYGYVPKFKQKVGFRREVIK